MALLALAASAPAAAECESWPWRLLGDALERGDVRTIVAMVGDGRVSLSVDGIPPGSYTAAQAGRLLGGFFKSTASRRLQYRACGASSSTRWGEALLRYRPAGAPYDVEEHILLEMCGSGREAVLCGIRSASPPRPSAT